MLIVGKKKENSVYTVDDNSLIARTHEIQKFVYHKVDLLSTNQTSKVLQFLNMIFWQQKQSVLPLSRSFI